MNRVGFLFLVVVQNIEKKRKKNQGNYRLKII